MRFKYTLISNGSLVEVIDSMSGSRVFCGDYATFYMQDGACINGKVIKIELIPETHPR